MKEKLKILEELKELETLLWSLTSINNKNVAFSVVIEKMIEVINKELIDINKLEKIKEIHLKSSNEGNKIKELLNRFKKILYSQLEILSKNNIKDISEEELKNILNQNGKTFSESSEIIDELISLNKNFEHRFIKIKDEFDSILDTKTNLIWMADWNVLKEVDNTHIHKFIKKGKWRLPSVLEIETLKSNFPFFGNYQPTIEDKRGASREDLLMWHSDKNNSPVLQLEKIGITGGDKFYWTNSENDKFGPIVINGLRIIAFKTTQDDINLPLEYSSGDVGVDVYKPKIENKYINFLKKNNKITSANLFYVRENK